MTDQPTRAGFVAIIGEPNAGKSTLLNTLLGVKLSIVTPKPQTTRKNVLGIWTEKNVQMAFVDTPGILRPRYELHTAMMKGVDEAISGADAVLLLIDATKGSQALRVVSPALQMQLSECATQGKPIFAAINKMDALSNPNEALQLFDKLAVMGFVKKAFAISALQDKYVSDVIEALSGEMPEHDFYYDAELLSEQPQRFFVSELIREVVFREMREELPYSSEVQISEFREREGGKWYISADIIVERKSQKIIMVGERGENIKRIGMVARKAVEQHLEMPVYLELFVKVREDWRDNPTALRSFGY